MALFDIAGSFKPRHVAGIKNSRFIEPHGCEEIDESRLKYANAEKLADDIGDLPLNFRAFVILDGKFIFGDFLEALIVSKNWECQELTISTLSMSRENVDSLANLINGGYLKQLNLIVSHYYFSTERRELMPYIYDQLDVNDVLQVAVASVHTKIAMIRTTCGKKIVIHGSANLRTSSNIEQIVIEHSPHLFDFCASVHHNIIELHKTINKPIRSKTLWQQVLQAGQENPHADSSTANPPQPSQDHQRSNQPHLGQSTTKSSKPQTTRISANPKSTRDERF
jgi:hypothetical protein